MEQFAENKDFPNGGFPPLYKMTEMKSIYTKRNFATPKGNILSVNDLLTQFYK